MSNELGGHNSRRSQRLFGIPDYLIRLAAADVPGHSSPKTPGSVRRPDFATFPSAIVIKQAAGP